MGDEYKKKLKNVPFEAKSGAPIEVIVMIGGRRFKSFVTFSLMQAKTGPHPINGKIDPLDPYIELELSGPHISNPIMLSDE